MVLLTAQLENFWHRYNYWCARHYGEREYTGFAKAVTRVSRKPMHTAKNFVPEAKPENQAGLPESSCI
ncbi:MAG: hypothetical protein HY761_03310 [Candidatus Omnitrophica bacterium]|nr:hypothetical protein [Candidatus Omnitrophota bacterium]